MIEWGKTSKKDMLLISRIVKKAVLQHDRGYDGPALSKLDAQDLTMDITAAHLKAPLDLEKLSCADMFNFNHDVYGIMRHIDRDTGEMNDCFSLTT